MIITEKEINAFLKKVNKEKVKNHGLVKMLSKVSKVNYTSVSAILSGKRKCTYNNFFKLYMAFDRSLEEIKKK